MIVRARSLRKTFKTQKGIAAILLVLLTGISATVVTFGVMSHVKSSQRSQLAVHGQTQAELNAWASAEALKQFLDGNEIGNALLTDYSFSFSDGKAFASAAYVDSCSDTDNNQYCYQISAKSAQNVASLEVVYNIPVDKILTFVSPTQALIFKGDLDITGGGIDVSASHGTGVAVDGNLTITSAATSKISGCAVGNISVDGGGVKDNAYLYSSSGDIFLTGLNAVGLSVWGGNINIVGGGGHYTSIKAVNDVAATGVGNFVSDDTWVNSFSISPRGEFNNSARIKSDIVLGNGNSSEFDGLQVGGDMIVVSSSHYPTLNSTSTINGDVKIGNSLGTTVPVSAITNLTRSSSIPDAPLRPECDVETNKFDVDSLLSMANYIFYIDEETNKRMLKIQNVKNSSDISVDGTYELDTYDQLSGMPQFRCGYHAGGGNCYAEPPSWSSDLTWQLTGIYSFPKGIVVFGGRGNPNRNVLASASVQFNGFANDTLSSPLINTVLSTGDLILTSASGQNSRQIVAPYFADASEACGDDFYPSNICENTSSGKEFITIDQDGKTWKKLELANTAIMVNKSLDIAGWKVKGHVVIGSSVKTSANDVSVTGIVMVGVNEENGGNANVNQGGLTIDTSTLTEDQLRVNTGSDSHTVSANLGTPSLSWARYR